MENLNYCIHYQPLIWGRVAVFLGPLGHPEAFPDQLGDIITIAPLVIHRALTSEGVKS